MPLGNCAVGKLFQQTDKCTWNSTLISVSHSVVSDSATPQTICSPPGKCQNDILDELSKNYLREKKLATENYSISH